MYRTAMNELLKWKSKQNKKPLIIRGAIQVGKTWLMKHFGQENYAHCVYINFDNNKLMRKLFEHDLDIRNIIMGIESLARR